MLASMDSQAGRESSAATVEVAATTLDQFLSGIGTRALSA